MPFKPIVKFQIMNLRFLCLFFSSLFFKLSFAQSTVFNSPLTGCPAGMDSIVFQSNFQTDPTPWKAIGFVPGPPVNGDWEYGTPITGADLCDLACVTVNTTRPPVPPNALTNFWGTNLDGCYGLPTAGTGTLQILANFSLRGIQAPIEITWQHWWRVYFQEQLNLTVDGQVIYTEPIAGAGNVVTGGWLDHTITNDPILNSYAGQSVVIEFNLPVLGSVCNERGWYMSNLGIRGCKVTGISVVPTMGEWALILLTLGLVIFATLFMGIRQKAFAGYEKQYFSFFGKLPFEIQSFKKILGICSVLLVFVLAIIYFLGNLIFVDFLGLLIVTPVFAYLLHLLLWFKKA